MTPAQISLLQRCIDADRQYRTKIHADVEEGASNSERGVEIGVINGVDPRTAYALQDAGLIEIVNLYGKHGWAFLGKFEPYDEKVIW